MCPNVTQEDNLLFQSYFTVCLLKELFQGQSLVRSNYFRDLHFDVSDAKKAVANQQIEQGCLLMCLYALLVIPKQKLEKKYPTLFNEINSNISALSINTTTTYEKDKPTIDYVRHIRNAVLTQMCHLSQTCQ